MVKKFPKKTGGSQASDAVTKLVTPSTYEHLSNMFSDKFSLTGGRKLVKKIDVNETQNEKMMVYNISAGAKKKKPVKKMVKKGGSSIPIIDKPVGRMDPITTPPAAVPSSSQSTLNMTPVSMVQQQLASQNITTMQPITKNTVYPSGVKMYDGPFALGGAKKKTTKKVQKKKTTKK